MTLYRQLSSGVYLEQSHVALVVILALVESTPGRGIAKRFLPLVSKVDTLAKHVVATNWYVYRSLF